MNSYASAAVSLALQPLRSTVNVISSCLTSAQRTAIESRRVLQHSIAFITRDRTEHAHMLVAMPSLLLDVARDAHAHRCTELLAQLMLDLVALMQLKEIRTITMAVSGKR